MALGELSLTVTQGAQGRSFKSKINGLSGLYVEVVGPRGHDFSVINGFLVSQAIELEISAVTIRERDAAGFRDTTVIINSGSPATVRAQALAAGSVGVFFIVNLPQPDGSMAPTVVARTAAGVSVLTSPSGGSTPTPTPTPTPTLNTLTVSPSSATVGTAYSGTISGLTSGSSVALTGAGAAGLSIAGAVINGTPTTAGAINLVETLAGATGSPRTSSGVATVAAAQTGLPTTQPTFTPATTTAGFPAEPQAYAMGA